MTKTYSVQAGDTLISIAFHEGFRTWETIWNHPQNQALRDMRSDPTGLYVGDEIFIPDKVPKSISIKTFDKTDKSDKSDKSTAQNQNYIFQVKSLNVYLSLVLEDDNGEPYRGKKYRISGNTQTIATAITGRTDQNGFFSAALPPETQNAELTLWKSDTDETQTVIWNFKFGATATSNDRQSLQATTNIRDSENSSDTPTTSDSTGTTPQKTKRQSKSPTGNP